MYNDTLLGGLITSLSNGRVWTPTAHSCEVRLGIRSASGPDPM